MRSLVHVVWLAAAILFPRPAAPSCIGTTTFCEKLPERSDRNTVVFVGVVKQLFPPPSSGALPARDQSPSVPAQNRVRSGGPVPLVEKRHPSVRLQVIESFLDSQPDELVVRITSDLFVDGVPVAGPPFQQGETWLVEAVRDRVEPEVWVTSNCLRTKPVSAAQGDIQVLRAWAAQRPLPARITGEVWDTANAWNVAGVRIHLRGQGKNLSTVSDSRGQFAFEGLTPGIYEIAAALPGAGGPVKIDLTNALCSRIVLRPK